MHTEDVNRFLRFSGCQIVRDNTLEPLEKTLLNDHETVIDMVLTAKIPSVDYFVHVLQCNEKMRGGKTVSI